MFIITITKQEVGSLVWKTEVFSKIVETGDASVGPAGTYSVSSTSCANSKLTFLIVSETRTLYIVHSPRSPNKHYFIWWFHFSVDRVDIRMSIYWWRNQGSWRWCDLSRIRTANGRGCGRSRVPLLPELVLLMYLAMLEEEGAAVCDSLFVRDFCLPPSSTGWSEKMMQTLRAWESGLVSKI